MDHNIFNKLVFDRCEKTKEVLMEKAKEYARGPDRMRNFNRAQELTGRGREKCIWDMAIKHYISFLDILDEVEEGSLPDEQFLDEKIGDLVNYLILVEASIKEKIWEQKKK